MAIQKKHVDAVVAAYANCLTRYGPENMATIRAEIAKREIEDGLRAQKELRELKRDMKSRGIKRSSMMNGGHSQESMRANERCFALETAIERGAKHAQ